MMEQALPTGRALRQERLEQLTGCGCFRNSVRECVVCHQGVEWWLGKRRKFFLLTAVNLQMHSECCRGWYRNRPPAIPTPHLRPMGEARSAK